MNGPKTVPDRPVSENKNLAMKNSVPRLVWGGRQLECVHGDTAALAARPTIAVRGAPAFMNDEILTDPSDEPCA
jgi:hypothetical protein